MYTRSHELCSRLSTSSIVELKEVQFLHEKKFHFSSVLDLVNTYGLGAVYRQNAAASKRPSLISSVLIK